MGGFDNTRQVLGRSRNAQHKLFQFIQPCVTMGKAPRSYAFARLIQHLHVMMGVCPIQANVPHTRVSLSEETPGGVGSFYNGWQTARPSNHRLAQEGCQGKRDLSLPVEPCGRKSLSPAVRLEQDKPANPWSKGSEKILTYKEETTSQLQALQEEICRVDRLRKQLPSGDPFDGEFRRLFYCRYADDYLIGIIGSKADAEEARQQVRRFVEETLKLTIAEEKSHIRHSRQGATFLGYEVKTYSGQRIVKVKRGPRHTLYKATSERIQLHIPAGKLEQFCKARRYGDYHTMNAHSRGELTTLSDAEILLTYNGELQGLAQYYALACGVKQRMNKLAYIWQTSFFKTLAHKHRQSVQQITTRLKTDDGYVLTIPQKDRTRSLHLFRLKNLKSPSPGKADIDQPPNTLLFTLSRSELIRRLNTRQCEYCETTQGPFEVHHIRKLKDIKQGKTVWQRMMMARRRKTLVLCRSCHHLLHAGTLPNRDHASYKERESRVR